MAGPTNYPNGLSNEPRQTLFGNLPLLNPAKLHVFFDDFDLFPESASASPASIQWNTLITAGGDIESDTTGLAGSVLTFTTNASSNAVARMKPWTNGFSYEFGKQTWFEFKFTPTNDFTVANIHFGLQPNNNTQASDVVFFVIGNIAPPGAGDFGVQMRVRRNNVQELNETTNIECFADESLAVGTYWDGKGKLSWYANGVLSGSATLLEDQLPLGFLNAHMSIEALVASAQTMRVDYALAVQER